MANLSADSNANTSEKEDVARGRNIGLAVAALILLCWNAYSPAVKWWERKGFEAAVEKTLVDRGVVIGGGKPDTQIVEYGTGKFKERALPAVVVRADFVLVDATAGEKTPQCVLMYGLIDKEFDAYRAMSLTDCSNSKDLEAWKRSVSYR